MLSPDEGGPSAPAAPRRRLRSRASWTLADQVISSATNAALSVVVARSVGAAEFGAFSVAFLVFSFLVGLARASITDPLIVRFTSGDSEVLFHAGRRAAGASLAVGVVAGAISAGVGGLLGGSVGNALLGLAIVLPGLLVQDAWRQLFFAVGRPSAATVNDAVWAVAQAALLTTVLVLDADNVFTLTVAWGSAATVAALVGCIQARGLPQVRSWWTWLTHHRDLGGSLAVSYTVNMGAVHITMTLVGVIGGLAAVGAIRAAQVLLGPLQVLYPGLRSFALPLLSKRAENAPRTLLKPAAGLSAFAVVAATSWVALLLVMPQRWGVELLGASWEQARQVLPPVGATTIIIGASFGAVLLLKARSRGGTLLTMNLVQSPLIIGLGCAGAYVDGARGAALGLAVAHLVGFVQVWATVVRDARRPSAGARRLRPG